MELGNEFRARIEEWDGLSRWERSELGKDVRRVGLSYGEIMDLIPVKKSTLATWFRDVRLTQEQWAAIKSRRPPISGIPRDTQRKRHRETDLIGLKHDSKPFTFRTTPSGQWAFPSTGPKGQSLRDDSNWPTPNPKPFVFSYPGLAFSYGLTRSLALRSTCISITTSRRLRVSGPPN